MSAPATRWILASGNLGKVREFQALLAPLGITVTPQRELGIDDADEPHPSFVENAIVKARHAARASGLAALADDSGLCVPALGGAPGVRSARYAADAAQAEVAPAVDTAPAATLDAGRDAADAANNRLLIARIAGLPAPVAAYYYCVIVLVRHPDDPRPLIAEGVWDGTLTAVPRGHGGFGYDPHFVPAGQSLTAAEMSAADKNRISHRARALQALLAALGR
ncbi:MAG: non-canonical purine NTP pyrophosphatase [Lautropia sp.]